ncbi:MAG: hypothetical protein D8M59_09900 [Planctomycetes bacterium]|nr:hypothetical protein [Planctomycetota bacterium]NOG53428.1 hypothetical protein [Planctomycetota bacterium]
MEQLFQQYKDIAEFRLVYINEAHASDSDWPVEYAKELGITQHEDYGQRCTVAERLLEDKQLTIPTLIDGMDNAVNKAYQAWPDRIYVIQPNGKLAVAADRGPRGFKPALNQATEWLADYRKSQAHSSPPAALSDEPLAIEVGLPFPDIMLPSVQNGSPMAISDFRGKKIILHVFASW